MTGKIFGKELKVVNIGVQTFYETIKQQGVEAVHVDWRPPAGGNARMAKLLKKLI